MTCKPQVYYSSNSQFVPTSFLRNLRDSLLNHKLYSKNSRFYNRNIPRELRVSTVINWVSSRIKEIKIPEGLKTPISVIMEDPLFANIWKNHRW